MKFSRFEFRPSLVPTLVALGMVLLTVALGHWQLERAAEKLALQQRYEWMSSAAALQLTGAEREAEPLFFRRLAVHGQWVAEGQILLDNKVHDGVAGYYVLTPLRIGGGERHVLVNRGWIARGRDYPSPPAVPVPRGSVSVEGIGVQPSARFVELSSQTVQGMVWQNLVLERYRERIGLDILPIVLVQVGGPADGLARVKEQPDSGIAKHQGYAFQWFALAAAIVITYVVVNTKRIAS